MDRVRVVLLVPENTRQWLRVEAARRGVGLGEMATAAIAVAVVALASGLAPMDLEAALSAERAVVGLPPVVAPVVAPAVPSDDVRPVDCAEVPPVAEPGC